MIQMRHGPLSLPYLLLVFLLVGSAPQAARWPDWAAEVPGNPLVESLSDAVVLLDERDIVLQDGERKGTRRWLIRAVTEGGIEHATMLLVRGGFDEYSRVRVWTRDPRGRVARTGQEEGLLFSQSDLVLLDNTEVLVLEPRGMVPGSSMAVEYDFRSTADLPQDRFRVQGKVPVLRSVVRIRNDSPNTWKVKARVAGGRNPGPAMVDVSGEWVFSNLPALSPSDDPGAPRPPGIELSLDYLRAGGEPVFADWGATARWALELFRVPERPHDEVERALEHIRRSGGDPVKEVGHLVRELRYFGIEIGWGGFRPRAPETTLTRSFGDCKDKSHLMVTLLRALGIEAYPVLTAALSHRHIHEELPSPRSFNHCVVGIPWDGRETRPGMALTGWQGGGAMRIFDPTLSEMSPLDIPFRLEGAPGLIVDERTRGLIEFSESAAGDNVAETRYQMVLKNSGSLAAKAERRLAGGTRIALQGDEGEVLSQDKLREMEFARANAKCPGISRLRITTAREYPDGRWGYDASYRCHDALARFGDLRLLELGKLRPLEVIPLPESLADTRYLPRCTTQREIVEIEHGSLEPVQLPESLEVENEVGTVSVLVTREAGHLIIQRELELARKVIPYSRAADAEALRRALHAANRAAVVFVESDAPEATPGP